MDTDTFIRIRTRAVSSLWAGNPAYNMYFYQVAAHAGAARGLDAANGALILAAFKTLVVDKVRAMTSSDWSYDQGQIIDYTDPAHPFYEGSITPGQGTVVDGALPPFNAWAFRLNRGNATTRNGQKRFVGLPESLVAQGRPDSAATTLANALATALGDELIVDLGGDSWTFIPVIVREAPGYTVSVSQYVASVTFTGISTQNTRKH